MSEFQHFDTLAVRAGQTRGIENEHSEPIYTTSSFVFESAAKAAACFNGSEKGNVYSRFSNPTVRTFEERLAALENGQYAVATASGMAAILCLHIALLASGDHVVCSRSVFGTTRSVLDKYLVKLGVEVDYVDLASHESWTNAIKPNTKLFFLETPSNPQTDVADIVALADLAHAHNILLAVDNCFCTPALQRPLDMGADIIIHSATKYLDGQGRCLGGALVMNDPELHNVFFGFLRNAGPTMSPFNAWVFLKGLETLSLRMKAHSSHALELATWLETHDAVSHVNYPGLASHPQHQLAKQQQSAFGGILSFSVKGGQENAWKVMDATTWLSITANLGDTKTTITHPATTTHWRLTPDQREEARIDEGLIRVAVGLENVDDIKQELKRGLDSLV